MCYSSQIQTFSLTKHPLKYISVRFFMGYFFEKRHRFAQGSGPGTFRSNAACGSRTLNLGRKQGVIPVRRNYGLNSVAWTVECPAIIIHVCNSIDMNCWILFSKQGGMSFQFFTGASKIRACRHGAASFFFRTTCGGASLNRACPWRGNWRGGGSGQNAIDPTPTSFEFATATELTTQTST